MGAFARSWEITKLTFSIMKKEKELFLFPILSIIFSLLFVIAIFFPTIIVVLLRGDSVILGGLEYLLIFLTYFGIAFIATFFNVCVVYTAALAFSKKEAKFWTTIKFALSRIHIILLWSIIVASVGLILKIIEGIAERTKGIGRLILSITRELLSMAWSVATIFVIPGMVYHNLGPFAAIKKSVQVLKKTWGEKLILYVGMNLIAIIFILPAAAIAIFMVYLLIVGSINLLLALSIIAILFAYMISIGIFFSVAGNIFNTALYVYGESKVVVPPYRKDLLTSAFKPMKKQGILG